MLINLDTPKDYTERLVSMAHSSIDQRNFQDSVVRGMQQLAAAVHRQNDEDSDVDEYFQITEIASFNRLNHKFKDRHLQTKLVSKKNYYRTTLQIFHFNRNNGFLKLEEKMLEVWHET